jgi:hypothetical protein
MQDRRLISRAESALRWSARGLSWAVLGFWLWFFVASWISERADAGWTGSQIHIYQTAISLAALALAFFFELAGGVVFIALAALSYYGWGHRNPSVALLMSLPLLLIGALYAAAWALGRRKAAQHLNA